MDKKQRNRTAENLYNLLRRECPNDGCDAFIKGKDFKTHQRLCEYAVVKCQYAVFGCEWTGKKRELDFHACTVSLDTALKVFEEIEPKLVELDTKLTASQQYFDLLSSSDDSIQFFLKDPLTLDDESKSYQLIQARKHEHCFGRKVRAALSVTKHQERHFAVDMYDLDITVKFVRKNAANDWSDILDDCEISVWATDILGYATIYDSEMSKSKRKVEIRVNRDPVPRRILETFGPDYPLLISCFFSANDEDED